jgi:uncharacterized protein (TIGR02117 family)
LNNERATVIHRFFRVMRALLVSAFAACILYLAAALILGYFPANRDFTPTPGGTEIFVCSNGVHTDFVLPVKNAGFDWTQIFPPRNFPGPVEGFDHIGIGWGDLAFYKDTPRWRDLKFATAWNALLGTGPAAIHAGYRRAPGAGEKCGRLEIDAAQYARLRNYVIEALSGIGVPAASGYGRRDAFYYAQGHFSPVMTCNAWINRGLEAAGLPSGIWAPFDFLLLHHLR